MHAPLTGVGTPPAILILAIPSRRIHPSITPCQLVTICCVICRLFHETSPHLSIISWGTSPFLPYPLIHVIGTTFGSLTTSPPFRSKLTILNDIPCIWSTTEHLEYSSDQLIGRFYHTTPYCAKTWCHDPRQQRDRYSALELPRTKGITFPCQDRRTATKPVRRVQWWGRLRRVAAATLNGGRWWMRKEDGSSWSLPSFSPLFFDPQ